LATSNVNSFFLPCFSPDHPTPHHTPPRQRVAVWVYTLSADATQAVALLHAAAGPAAADALRAGSDLRERLGLLANHPFAEVRVLIYPYLGLYPSSSSPYL